MKAAAEFREPGRWGALAAAIVAQAAMSALQQGLPVLGPALRETYDLSLPALGALLASVNWGEMATLMAGGALADRIGERPVVAIGLDAVSGPVGAAAVFVAAALSYSWNGLAFTRVAEFAGRARAGAALWLHGTLIGQLSAPAGAAFGWVAGESGFAPALLALAAGPALGAAPLGPLRAEERRRMAR